MRNIIAAAALVVALSGCAEYQRQQDEARAAAIDAGDQRQCVAYGFSPGTLDYAQCRMMIDQRRQASSDAMRRAVGLRMLGLQ